MTATDGERISEAFRAEWPRILAAVIRFTGSVDLAEDAVQEAFTRALSARNRALLINPAAWITTAAKRIAIDAVRRDAALRMRLPLLAGDLMRDPPVSETGVPRMLDDRLELLYLACAPQLEPETRLALALRFACGVPTEGIADALLVEHTAMSARLTRAKRRIERDGIRFEPPDANDRSARLDDVLATIYVLYTTGHASPALNRGDPPPTAVAVELARELHRLHPADTEVAGLLGLLLLTEARSSTRFDAQGALITLEDADRERWNPAAIREGLDLAADALPGGGRFALQAAIAGLHADARTWRETDWTAIGVFYERLLSVWPSPAAALARIVAVGYGASGPIAALAELDALEPTLNGLVGRNAVAVRADLLRRAGRLTEARAMYLEARSVAPQGPVREFFTARITGLDRIDATESG